MIQLIIWDLDSFFNIVFGNYFAMSILMYLGLIGVFLGIMYTGFLRLAYNGFGDLAVFIGFGPLMVYGAAYMQNQTVDPITTLLFSLPVGILIALVLFILSWINL